MQIVSVDELSNMMIEDTGLNVFRVLSPLDSRFARVVNKIRGIDTLDLVSVLNRINNQGITAIDANTYSYVIDDCINLSYSDMATSELLFLFAYSANYSKSRVFICNYLDQLCMNTCKLFFTVFGKSDYINMVVDEFSVHFYENLLNGES